MARIETWFNQDLQNAVKVNYIDGNVFSADNQGNVVGVNLFDGGVPATISGSVAANIIRSDGVTVAASGTLSGNKCSVVLPQSAYAVTGAISIIIKLTIDTTVTTVCAIVANVYQSTTDTVVDPGTIIPSIETLIAAIDEAVESIPLDYSELSLAVAVNEHLLNTGTYTIAASDMESGTWSFTTKAANSKRLRLNRLFPIRKGMRVYYSNPTLQFTIGVFTTKTATAYAQSTGWISAGSSGVVDINYNGYMIIMCQSANDITVADYDCTVTVKTVIEETSIISRGILPDGTDLNDVTTPGCWVLTAGYTYTHNPLSSGTAGVFVVYSPYSTIVKQTVYRVAPYADVYERSAVNGSFYSWNKYDFVGRKTIIANNTDFDNILEPGTYFIQSGYTYTHSPFASSVGGTLFVFPEAYPGSRVQMAISYSTTGENVSKVRMGINNTYPSSWANLGGNIYNNTYQTDYFENTYNITCSPSITTDTNNYLASTGDQTDRSADIQAMLNSTGVCHLGAGLFMVSGVDIPDYCSVIGSGMHTMVRLLPSVANGYAFKMGTQSSLSNMRISGGTSAPTLSSTVGSRHGVLFEGTKHSGQSGGETESESTVDNCIISNFEGGGITCTGTGVNLDSNMIISDCIVRSCGAGIYIPYYSEFHRVSNCAFVYNYYGCVDNGGNNNFSNCDFSGNRVGILIDNSTGQSPNNSHGTFSSCSVNHSYTDEGVINGGTAIKLLGVEHGEIFTGMQIFYGAIVIDDSNGVRFIGANFGNISSAIPITVTDSKVVTFSDCTFAQSPSLTQSNNTVLKFTECYLLNGTAYNPV